MIFYYVTCKKNKGIRNAQLDVEGKLVKPQDHMTYDLQGKRRRKNMMYKRENAFLKDYDL